MYLFNCSGLNSCEKTWPKAVSDTKDFGHSKEYGVLKMALLDKNVLLGGVIDFDH